MISVSTSAPECPSCLSVRMLPAQAPCAFTHLQQIVSGQGPALNSLTDSCQKLRRLQKQEFFLVRDERPANIDTKHLN